LKTSDWYNISGGTQSINGSYTVCSFTANNTLILS
jgi:hypothetical protein